MTKNAVGAFLWYPTSAIGCNAGYEFRINLGQQFRKLANGEGMLTAKRVLATVIWAVLMAFVQIGIADECDDICARGNDGIPAPSSACESCIYRKGQENTDRINRETTQMWNNEFNRRIDQQNQETQRIINLPPEQQQRALQAQSMANAIKSYLYNYWSTHNNNYPDATEANARIISQELFGNDESTQVILSTLQYYNHENQMMNAIRRGIGR